jgi:2-hydroxychromene-2-carboxylate isomerase
MPCSAPTGWMIATSASCRWCWEIADQLGIDRDAFTAAIATPEIKDRLRQETDAAIARGMFGVPYIMVDGEPFWGADRLPQIDKWLATGGF